MFCWTELCILIKIFGDRVIAKNADEDSARPLHGSTFERNRTLPDGPLSPDHIFEAAVCLVQEGLELKLSFEEKRTLVRALKTEIAGYGTDFFESDDSDDEQLPGSPGFYAAVKEAETKRKARSGGSVESKYVNLNFVLGSAAEVERIWSMAKYILVQQRRKMSPKVFECLICLKYNREFWDEAMVVTAYRNAKAKKRSDHVAKLHAIIAAEEADLNGIWE